MLKFVAVAVPLLALGPAAAIAGQSIDQAGTLTCVNDKWDETEPEKGHKLVVYAGRCVIVYNDASAASAVEDCAGNYEYMPDGKWKGNGICTVSFKGGSDTLSVTWEEGDALKDYLFSVTGGTGKYKGAKGGGTYKTEELTPTLYAGRKKGKIDLP